MAAMSCMHDQMLESNRDDVKLEAMRCVTVMTARGKLSGPRTLFPHIVKNVSSTNPELKKLIYLYLTNFADQEPDLALLPVATLQKSLKSPNPLIRSSALKVLTSMRLNILSAILMATLRNSVNDLSPYVRKTVAHSIIKIYRLDPGVKPDLIEYIARLIDDKNSMVLSSAVATFEVVCPERLDLIQKQYKRFCFLMADCNEWGQTLILNLLTRYIIKTCKHKKGNTYLAEQDPRVLLRSAKPLIHSNNSAVVMAVIKLYIAIANHNDVRSTITRPLIRLLYSHREIQLVVLDMIENLTSLSNSDNLAGKHDDDPEETDNGPDEDHDDKKEDEVNYSEVMVQDKVDNDEGMADNEVRVQNENSKSMAKENEKDTEDEVEREKSEEEDDKSDDEDEESDEDDEESDEDDDEEEGDSDEEDEDQDSSDSEEDVNANERKNIVNNNNYKIRSNNKKSAVTDGGNTDTDKDDKNNLEANVIDLDANKNPEAFREVFRPYIKSFFVKHTDCTQIRLAKLRILTNLSSPVNVTLVLRELQAYISCYVEDKEFVSATIHAIERCALIVHEVAHTCLNGLTSLLSNNNEHIVSEAIVVLRSQIINRKPTRNLHEKTNGSDNKIDDSKASGGADQHDAKSHASSQDDDDDKMVSTVIKQVTKLLPTVTAPQARATILWILAEFCDKNRTAAKCAPNVLRMVAKSFCQEDNFVKLQSLTLASKFLLSLDKNEKADLYCKIQLLAGYLFSLAKYDINHDVRDRGRFLKKLLENEDVCAKVLNSCKQPGNLIIT